MNLFDVLKGWKTYIGVLGLVLLAEHQLLHGELSLAFQNFLAALAAFGVRNAIFRSDAVRLAQHKEMLCHLKRHNNSTGGYDEV